MTANPIPSAADERAWHKKLIARAGIEPHEWSDHPQFGLCLTLAGIKKLALLAPDQARAAACVAQTEKAIRDALDEPPPRWMH